MLIVGRANEGLTVYVACGQWWREAHEAPDLNCRYGNYPGSYPGCIALLPQSLNSQLYGLRKTLCCFTVVTSRLLACTRALLGRLLLVTAQKHDIKGKESLKICATS